jgi:redox-regulated HSP33 family molecular chaperone
MAGAVRAMTINAKHRTNENAPSNALLGNEEHFTNKTLLVQIEENCRLEQWVVTSESGARVKAICFLRVS